MSQGFPLAEILKISIESLRSTCDECDGQYCEKDETLTFNPLFLAKTSYIICSNNHHMCGKCLANLVQTKGAHFECPFDRQLTPTMSPAKMRPNASLKYPEPALIICNEVDKEMKGMKKVTEDIFRQYMMESKAKILIAQLAVEREKEIDKLKTRIHQLQGELITEKTKIKEKKQIGCQVVEQEINNQLSVNESSWNWFFEYLYFLLSFTNAILFALYSYSHYYQRGSFLMTLKAISLLDFFFSIFFLIYQKRSERPLTFYQKKIHSSFLLKLLAIYVPVYLFSFNLWLAIAVFLLLNFNFELYSFLHIQYLGAYLIGSTFNIWSNYGEYLQNLFWSYFCIEVSAPLASILICYRFYVVNQQKKNKQRNLKINLWRLYQH